MELDTNQISLQQKCLEDLNLGTTLAVSFVNRFLVEHRTQRSPPSEYYQLINCLSYKQLNKNLMFLEKLIDELRPHAPYDTLPYQISSVCESIENCINNIRRISQIPA